MRLADFLCRGLTDSTFSEFGQYSMQSSHYHILERPLLHQRSTSAVRSNKIFCSSFILHERRLFLGRVMNSESMNHSLLLFNSRAFSSHVKLLSNNIGCGVGTRPWCVRRKGHQTLRKRFRNYSYLQALSSNSFLTK